MIAILTREAAAAARAALAPEAEIRTVEPGQGPAALAEAARVPVDTLILDVDAGPGLGPAVLRYRLARPSTRVVLLAAGRQPGDPEVAATVAAGVYDVVTDPADLGRVLAGPPADIAAAARWMDPSLGPEGAARGPQVVERVVERRVAVTSRPAVLAVAGVGPGVGATTLAAMVAGYLARLGHPVALVEAAPTPALRLLSGVTEDGAAWVPGIRVWPNAALGWGAIRTVVRTRVAPYIIADLGATPRTRLAELDVDLLLVVLPGVLHRYPLAEAWLHQRVRALREGASDAERDRAVLADRQLPPAARYVVLGGGRAAQEVAEAWVEATAICTPAPEQVYRIPTPDLSRWPPGYARPDPHLDAALVELLSPVLPDAPPARRGVRLPWLVRPVRRPRIRPEPGPEAPAPAPGPHPAAAIAEAAGEAAGAVAEAAGNVAVGALRAGVDVLGWLWGVLMDLALLALLVTVGAWGAWQAGLTPPPQALAGAALHWLHAHLGRG